MLTRIIFLILFASCSQTQVSTAPVDNNVYIIELNPNKQTALTRQNLEHLFKIFDLAPYLHKRKINIQSGVPPVSRPEFILNTKYSSDPNALLLLFLHLQLNEATIFEETNYKNLEQELMKYPTYSGLKSKRMLVQSFMNYQILTRLLKKHEAQRLIQSIAKSEHNLSKYYAKALAQEKHLNFLFKKYKINY